MSRRKQSNPKPLKREDEEDSPAGAAGGGAAEGGEDRGDGAEVTSPPQGPPPESPRSPPVQPDSPAPSAPRLRLNTSLAMDPALRSEVKSEASSPAADSPAVRAPSAVELEYLSVLPPAFHHALAGRLFPSPQLPDGDAVSISKVRSKSDPPQQVIDGRTVAVFMCTPCGIRFSSASTLEAHQTYYCSHRIQVKGRESDGDDPKSPQGEDDNPAKVSRTGKQYACPHCSYSADKKVSLNRHMRMHSSSPAAPVSLPVPVILPSPVPAHNGVEAAAADAAQLVDRYCQDCDIRFSSVKTLKAHKLHYCSSRHAKGSPASKTSSTPTSPSESQRISPEPPPPGAPGAGRLPGRPGQPFLLLRTNPILLVPYSLLQSASVFTGASQTLPSQDTPCILLPNGTVQPMSHLVPHLANDKELPHFARNANQHHLTEQVLKMREDGPSKNSRLKLESSAPLDLSIRRSSSSSDLVIDMEDEKENVNLYSPSPYHEDIVCAPSIPSLLGSGPATPDKRSPEDKKYSESYSSTPSPNTPQSPSSKKSPRRTPNGLSGAKDGTRAKKNMTEADYQNHLNLFMAAVASVNGAETGQRRNSLSGGKGAGPGLPGLPPLLLPPQIPGGAAADLLGPLPLLNPDLRISGLLGSAEPAMPQVLVKHGVSKCQECNIVFCKHENFIAHKKHYCSARLAEEGSPDDSSHTSPGSTKSPGPAAASEGKTSGQAVSGQAAAAKGPQTLYQFICMACGIKFTAIDNLTAHQTYYCPKRSADGVTKAPEDKTRRCSKCKMAVSGDHQCTTLGSGGGGAGAAGGGSSGWKCPCCEVVSATAAAAQKHMDTHTSVRAFRCTLCGYKGNTLRGMRTHIRMHFDKKNNDLQEEKYITCIVDEEGQEPSHVNGSVEVSAAAAAARHLQAPPGPPEPAEVVVKLEVSAEEEMIEVDDDPAAPGLEDRRNHCQACNITFNYMSSLIAHKKFYCTQAEGEGKAQSARSTPETSVQ